MRMVLHTETKFYKLQDLNFFLHVCPKVYHSSNFHQQIFITERWFHDLHDSVLVPGLTTSHEEIHLLVKDFHISHESGVQMLTYWRSLHV